MHNQTLQRQLDEIDFIRSNCAIVDVDQLCQSHWGRYLCLMVAGFLENALYELFRDYFDKTNRTNVRVPRSQNPNSKDFVNRAQTYNQSWTDELDRFMDALGRREAIDSIIARRNQIAHGTTAEITTEQVMEYLSKCVQVVDFMEGKLQSQTDTAV